MAGEFMYLRTLERLNHEMKGNLLDVLSVIMKYKKQRLIHGQLGYHLLDSTFERLPVYLLAFAKVIEL